MGQKWTFFDPTNNETYTFLANPTSDSPNYAKTETYNATTSPNGTIVIYEGADQPTVWSVQGDILTQGQYQTFLYWFQKRHQFQLTDDLGRVRFIYLTSFQPVRKMSRWFPWRHTYTLSGYTFSETFPTTPADPNLPFSFH